MAMTNYIAEAQRIVRTVASGLNWDVKEDDMWYAPQASVAIAGHVYVYSINILELDLESETGKADAERRLAIGLRAADKMAEAGRKIIEERSGNIPGELPMAAELEAFRKENQADEDRNRVVRELQCIVATFFLTEYFEFTQHSLYSVGDDQHAEVPRESLLSTIDALGSLGCAHMSVEYAMQELVIALGTSAVRSQEVRHAHEIESHKKMAEFGRGLDKINQRNQDISEVAKDKWRPLIDEVIGLVESDSKYSDSAACHVVAGKNADINVRTLKNRVSEARRLASRT